MVSLSDRPCQVLTGHKAVFAAIERFAEGLDTSIYEVISDRQDDLCCDVILIDDCSHHWQVEAHDTGEIELLRQKYLPNGGLKNCSLTPITSLSDFIRLAQIQAG